MSVSWVPKCTSTFPAPFLPICSRLRTQHERGHQHNANADTRHLVKTENYNVAPPTRVLIVFGCSFLDRGSSGPTAGRARPVRSRAPSWVSTTLTVSSSLRKGESLGSTSPTLPGGCYRSLSPLVCSCCRRQRGVEIVMISRRVQELREGRRRRVVAARGEQRLLGDALTMRGGVAFLLCRDLRMTLLGRLTCEQGNLAVSSVGSVRKNGGTR